MVALVMNFMVCEIQFSFVFFFLLSSQLIEGQSIVTFT